MTRVNVALGIGGALWLSAMVAAFDAGEAQTAKGIGRELSMPRHLEDDDEFRIPLLDLIEHGRQLFAANWTDQEGGGRPLMKGTGKELTDSSKPLVGARAFNRISAPDANSCAGCHNAPFGITGGGGDFVTNVFVFAQRFDFVTFERNDPMPTRSGTDEAKQSTRLDTVGNSRATPGMFGAGYLEMLAREITTDLHTIRDGMVLGDTRATRFEGNLVRHADEACRRDVGHEQGRRTGPPQPAGTDAHRSAVAHRPSVASGEPRHLAARVHQHLVQSSSWDPVDGTIRTEYRPGRRRIWMRSKPRTGSTPPGSRSKVQLRSSWVGPHSPIDSASSRPSSRRTMIARFAQGQARATISR